MRRQKITVNSRKFDLAIRKTWQCDLIEQDNALIVLVGKFDRDVEHAGLGSILKGTISYEYFWPDRWYNIFRFLEPNGSLRNYYCNVAMPPTFENGVLDYVDLDVDILVWPGGRYEVIDRDDFEINALKYDYPDEIRQRAEESVSEMLGMIEQREFPFGQN
jgi:protein associated with RNAse G/E